MKKPEQVGAHTPARHLLTRREARYEVSQIKTKINGVQKEIGQLKKVNMSSRQGNWNILILSRPKKTHPSR